MKEGFLKGVASFFAIFFILFVPFPFYLTGVQQDISTFLFGKLVAFLSNQFFHYPLSTKGFYSDSFSMYVLVWLLFILACIFALVVSQLKSWQRYKTPVFQFIYSFALYYLALQLMKYGADKLFKNQFYLPEPNILMTPLGKLDKDILYWSTMGSSYSYNLFLGIVEMVAAVLLLIRRTRLAGLLMSLGILVNVVAVNFSFDISVKLFTLFLLYLVLYLLVPYTRKLYYLFFEADRASVPVIRSASSEKPALAVFVLKWVAVLLILCEVFYPYLRSGSFNGDLSRRPFLHGAYEVRQMIRGRDTIIGGQLPLKRFFIHKDSYIIFQDSLDNLQDYKLGLNGPDSILVITNYQHQTNLIHFKYHAEDSTLTLYQFSTDGPVITVGKAIDWRKLPLLRRGFHWTID